MHWSREKSDSLLMSSMAMQDIEVYHPDARLFIYFIFFLFSVIFFEKISLPEQRVQLTGSPKSLTSLLASEIYDFCSLNKSSLPASNLLASCLGLQIGKQACLSGKTCLKLFAFAHNRRLWDASGACLKSFCPVSL